MNKNFEINIKNISPKEKKLREESLNLFNEKGFPNKRLEEWKFTDFSKIIENNFKELKINNQIDKSLVIKELKNFEHNSIFLIDGILSKFNFAHEDKQKFRIKEYSTGLIKKFKTANPLINLNNALSTGGFFLEISENYNFKKPLIIYNYFSNNLKNKMVNNKNLIKLNNKSNLEIVEINADISKNNYMQNNYTRIEIGNNSTLKNYNIQSNTSNGFFYKYIKVKLCDKSNYEEYIFSSGLKFNRIEEEVDIDGENAKCSIQSSLFLNLDSHQEIKTQINHLKPNSISHQKIKKVLNKNCKGAYQGKIYVKNIAQKTDAYQLSKALLLDNSSEFNAKPELEIYADDVKCSHGSTSGSMNEDSIFYLMTRGISRKNAVDLLTKAFLFEVVESISNTEIKKIIEKNLDRQIYGY